MSMWLPRVSRWLPEIPTNWWDQPLNLHVLVPKPVLLNNYHPELWVPWSFCGSDFCSSLLLPSSQWLKQLKYCWRKGIQIHTVWCDGAWVISWVSKHPETMLYAFFCWSLKNSAPQPCLCITIISGAFKTLDAKFCPGWIKSGSVGMAQAWVFLKLSCDPSVHPMQ